MSQLVALPLALATDNAAGHLRRCTILIQSGSCFVHLILFTAIINESCTDEGRCSREERDETNELLYPFAVKSGEEVEEKEKKKRQKRANWRLLCCTAKRPKRRTEWMAERVPRSPSFFVFFFSTVSLSLSLFRCLSFSSFVANSVLA